jgi:hypothetical protein
MLQGIEGLLVLLFIGRTSGNVAPFLYLAPAARGWYLQKFGQPKNHASRCCVHPAMGPDRTAAAVARLQCVACCPGMVASLRKVRHGGGLVRWSLMQLVDAATLR